MVGDKGMVDMSQQRFYTKEKKKKENGQKII